MSDDTIVLPGKALTDDQRRAIVQDRWDVAEFDDVAGVMPRLVDDPDLADASWTAPKAVQDLWAGLYQGVPRRNETLAPAYAVNGRVVDEIMGDANWGELHSMTMDDPVSAAIAALTMRDKLRDAFQRLQPVQDQADEAQAAQDDVDEAEEAAQQRQDDGLPADDEALAALETLRGRAEEALGDLDDQLNGFAGDTIAAVARQAAAEATEEAKINANIMSTWHIGPTDLRKTDPAGRLAMMELLRGDKMRQLTAMMGALRSFTFGARDDRLVVGPDDIVGITQGDDLTRILASELVSFLDDDLEDETMLRFLDRRLMQLDVRSVEKEGRGPVIYVEDNSLSTEGPREIFLRGLGLSLLDIAHAEGRGFCAIVFASTGQFEVFDFPTPAEFTIDKMLAYAQCTLHGATDFEQPLDWALSRLFSEFVETGNVSADVIFATDGESDISDEFAERWRTIQTVTGFHTWGISVGDQTDPDEMLKVCDRMASVESLTDGRDVADIFRTIR